MSAQWRLVQLAGKTPSEQLGIESFDSSRVALPNWIGMLLNISVYIQSIFSVKVSLN